jgi:Fe-S-cluster formation regulator IscX/YfhJ
LVDDERLKQVQREVARDPERHLDLAQRINVAKLDKDDKYRIRSNRSQSGGTKVTTFLDLISDYAVELGLLTDDDLRDAFKEEAEPVEKWHDSSHMATDLAEFFGTLDDALGTFGVTREGSWQEAHERLTEDEEPLYLSEFDDSFSRFVDPKTQNPFERIALLHEFRRSVENHDAWEVYEALDEMLDELEEFEVNTVGDLRNRLSELEELNEYQESKSTVIEATEEYK